MTKKNKEFDDAMEKVEQETLDSNKKYKEIITRYNMAKKELTEYKETINKNNKAIELLNQDITRKSKEIASLKVILIYKNRRKVMNYKKIMKSLPKRLRNLRIVRSNSKN